MMKTIYRIFRGLCTCFKAKGFIHVLRFIVLDIAGNRLGLPVDGHTKEFLFWEKQAMGLGDFSESFQERVELEKQKLRFPDEISEFIQQQSGGESVPHVLDVGCGPVSMLAYAHHENKIRLTGVDVLANSYEKLLYDYGYEKAIAGIHMVEAKAEELQTRFPENEFALTYCNNALDHTDSPQDSLKNMVSVTKPGGFTIISGYVREGSHESWDGIHMHDLFLENGRLFREGESGDKTCLDDNLPVEVVHHEMIQGEPKGKMIIVYRRTARKENV